MSCGNLAGWKTEAQSVKRSTQKKKEPSQVSMRTKTTMITNKSWVEVDLRDCHMKNQSEEIGALRSAKKTTLEKNWAEKAKETARKGSTQGSKVPLKKNNHEKELGKKLKKPKKKP